MALLRLVVEWGAFLHQLGQSLDIQRALFLHLKNLFGEIKNIATVAVGHDLSAARASGVNGRGRSSVFSARCNNISSAASSSRFSTST